MERPRGCLKTTLFGCLGIVALGVLLTAIAALVAWRGVGQQDLQDRELTPVAVAPEAPLTGKGGRLVLDLGQGEFTIKPAPPGASLGVEAHFDASTHELTDRFEVLPDSTWVYHLTYRRTIPGLQALLQAVMGGGTESRIDITIPDDLRVALELRVEEGGLEADIGGLWITEADIAYAKGGFALEIDQPLREPMTRLRVDGSMGGFAAAGIGNASPRVLDIDCRMGGADLDLTGDWRQDCDVRLSIRMGGMGVLVPEDLPIEGAVVTGDGELLRRADREIPLPVLRFELSQSMGEIEIAR